MTTEVLTYVIGAGAMVRAPRGRLFFVKSAPNGGLTITASGRPGSPIKFANISAGLKYGPVPESEHWEYLEITSATAQTVEMIIGDDDVEVAGTVSVAGTVTTSEATSSALITQNDYLTSSGTTTLVAANITRKSVTVQGLSSNSGSVRVGENFATAGRGLELQPGMSLTFYTSASVYIRNDSGANQNICVLEER